MQRSQVVPAALVASLLGVALAAAAEGAKPAAPAKVVGQVGDRKITLEDVDKKMDPKVLQGYYEERKKVLDQLVAEALLEREAKARGVTVAALEKSEITDKFKPVTDPDIEAFYNQNKARLTNVTLDQIKDRIREHLESEGKKTVRDSFLAELRKKTEVKTSLEPPRIAVAINADDPVKGPATAPVTIEFSEFQCPFCSRVGPILKQVEETYGDKVRIAFRHYPLPMHPDAPAAANASECAREQGKFWEYHDKLFANQKALQVAELKKYGAELDLDKAKFDACVDGNKYAEGVKQDAADGTAVGVTGTPAFFVNGRLMSGAQPFEAFKAVIDEELAAKK